MSGNNKGVVYHSFKELPNAPKPKKKKSPKTKEQEKFLGVCKVCKQPMSYVQGTNTVVCKNTECKGYKHVKKDKEGNKIVTYSPVFRVLGEKGEKYAKYLFENN